MKYKRFINKEDFSKHISETEFNEIIDGKFHYFDESGASKSCQCCGGNYVFLKLDVPDPSKLNDMLKLNNAKIRMNKNLEKHIQHETNKELENVRNEIESKIRDKHPKLIEDLN